MPLDFSGLGGAVDSIFSGVGSFIQAGSYDDAADLADKNAAIARLSTDIQLNQENRQAYKVIGATEAAVGAGGGALSGSALDVLKSNQQQLSLNKQLTEAQGEIDINSWKEKAGADRGAAEAAKASGGGDILGGILSIGSMFL